MFDLASYKNIKLKTDLLSEWLHLWASTQH